MAETKHGLPQTRGEFKLRGLVTGMMKENAFETKETKTKKKMNILRFGVQTAPESTTFVNVQGTEKEKVIFMKKAEVKGQQGEKREVPWGKRFEQQPEGFRLIGVNVGLQKDDSGKNITHTYTDFDAAAKLYDLLTDDMTVFVRGEIEYSSYKQGDEVRRNKKFNVKNIYASAVDFEDENFTETADFKQKIVYTGIEKVNDTNDPRFAVSAKIVTYQTIEDAEFIIRDAQLANQFRKNLKPYSAIDVWGKIYNKIDTEDVQETKNVWGQEDTFKTVKNNYIRELVITGADPESIDTETYTQEAIEEAVRVLNEFGHSDNSWGTDAPSDEDGDLPW